MNMHENIIAALRASSSLHLTAIEHYTMQAAHWRRWGYTKLAARAQGDAEEERRHLDLLLARLEDGDTSMDPRHPAPSGLRHDVVAMIQASLELEIAAAASERAGILTVRQFADEQSAMVFIGNLAGSESGIRECEALLAQIRSLGVEQFLQAMM